LAGDFRRGGVGEDILDLGDADILKKFLGVDRDSGADVLDIGVEARAGERAGGAVAEVAFGADDERAEFDHFRFRDRSGGNRGGDGRRERRRIARGRGALRFKGRAGKKQTDDRAGGEAERAGLSEVRAWWVHGFRL